MSSCRCWHISLARRTPRFASYSNKLTTTVRVDCSDCSRIQIIRSIVARVREVQPVQFQRLSSPGSESNSEKRIKICKSSEMSKLHRLINKWRMTKSSRKKSSSSRGRSTTTWRRLKSWKTRWKGKTKRTSIWAKSCRRWTISKSSKATSSKPMLQKSYKRESKSWTRRLMSRLKRMRGSFWRWKNIA